jgi:RNA polymerase sigma-70 factor (ECF subfamily)
MERVYQRFAPAVFRRARVMLGRDADAWEVVEEVLDRLLLSAGELRHEARPMAWIYRVTSQQCLNHLRARALREPLLAVVSGDPAVDAAATEALELLRQWVNHLEMREQSLATLVFLDRLMPDEVAEVLGLSRKTIEREIEQLRMKLQALQALPSERDDD